jgi:cell filamentation protein, protein adenylyltransferase
MVTVRKKRLRGRSYYYLEHSVRDGRRVEKKEKYLGKDLPENVEQLKREFLKSIYREKWFDRFDAIKVAHSARRKKLPPSARQKETETFMVRFTCNTNRIEGSKLTLRETALLLEKGITPGARPLDDVKEAEAHRAAFYEMLDYKKDLSLDAILYFHRLLFKDTKEDIAGRLRQHQMEISGSRFKPPLGVEVYLLLTDFFKWYGKNRKKCHPVELAALVHLKLVTIHPFADGNGRVGRLMMNFILNMQGFPMLDVPYEKRSGYYNALERSQVKEDDSFFLQWFFSRYIKEYRQYLEG